MFRLLAFMLTSFLLVCQVQEYDVQDSQYQEYASGDHGVHSQARMPGKRSESVFFRSDRVVVQPVPYGSERYRHYGEGADVEQHIGCYAELV